MPTDGSAVGHVSDTALMVAACRAIENERADGLVRDPFAERLAGARGRAIATAMPRFDTLCFGIGMRSRFIDELLLWTIAEERIEMVLSLGAGLDARPWRLSLPSELRWIEADFAGILEYKAAILTGDAPECRLERVPADLNDAAQRKALFARAAGLRTVVITEGLLMYLPGQTVEAIAGEAAREGAPRYWIMEITSPGMAKNIRLDSCETIQRVRAAGHIDGAQTLDVIQRNGWERYKHRSYLRDVMAAAPERAMALQRASISANLPPPEPLPADDPSGVHLFRRG